VQKHLALQPGLGLSQNRSQVAAARTTSGALAHRYLVVYDYRQNDVDHDAAGRFVEGFAGGSSAFFCVGDGTGAACPCTNTGSAGHGCANSFAPDGGLLATIGVPSTLADTAFLNATRMPPGSFCLFFQGTANASAAAFGDGLLCTGGTLTRLAVVPVDAAGAAGLPVEGSPSLSVMGGVPEAGGMRTYQGWYRDAASFCTGATFNLTNGQLIQWAR
jgi:hypothetical protein